MDDLFLRDALVHAEDAVNLAFSRARATGYRPGSAQMRALAMAERRYGLLRAETLAQGAGTPPVVDLRDRSDVQGSPTTPRPRLPRDGLLPRRAPAGRGSRWVRS